MFIKQLYTGCLAQAAYYIESEGEVAIVDPLRETEPYVQLANERSASIKYIFETHFHADFVSGHVDLAKQTGAEIVYGPTAKTSYPVHVAEDGEVFKIGAITITVLHTPGHTLESSTFLLKDEAGEDHAIFTGDTLFIGDVGRPDLAVKSDLTKEDLAGMLYDSLHEKILPLGDDVMVFPGHGAGSACGKNMSKETTATLGNQKQFNYALQDISKESFIEQLTKGIAPPPQYFPKNAALNKQGYISFEEVVEHGMKPLSIEAVQSAVADGALILDTRQPNEFAKGFIPGSMNIGLDGSFAVWVGTLIPDLTRPIIVIADEGKEKEAVTRLARVGYDNTVGYVQGGVEAWTAKGNDLDTVEEVTPDELYELSQSGNLNNLNILDVRGEGEFKLQHVIGVKNFPLNFINDNFQILDKFATYYVHCKSGYRSMITASILKSIGISNVINVKEGFQGMLHTPLPMSEEVCPSTVE